MNVGCSSRVCWLQTEKWLVDETRHGRPALAKGDRGERTSSRNSVGEPVEGFALRIGPPAVFI